MIKKSIFENDLIEGMQRNLKNSEAQNHSVSAAVDYLNSAISIFDEVGMISTADKILDVLNKITTDNTWEDELSGGLADKKNPNDFNKKALEKGMRVEMEHTDDEKIALEIAMDHLTEDPKYYDKLELIEGNHD